MGHNSSIHAQLRNEGSFMELIPPRPAVAARFDISLPYDLFTTLILLDSRHSAAGVSEWIARTRPALPGPLTAQLHELVGALRHTTLLWGRLAALAPGDPARRDFDAFLARLDALAPGQVRELALASVGQRLARWELEPDPARRSPEALGRPRRLIAALEALQRARPARRPGEAVDEPAAARLAELLLDGAALKALIGASLTTFWRDCYREQFQRDLPQLEAAVAFHREQRYPSDFAGLLLAVTGRNVPEVMARYLEGIAEVEFLPNAHIGPFLVFTAAAPIMLIACNALGRASQPQPPLEHGSLAHQLYPQLDALADASRLRIVELLAGREMYAHEIAQALDLSQSAISRHLQRLEQSGLVRVRREGAMKFYSLDPGRGRALAASLGQLMGPP
jgi:ArsR family transcriptional regulator